MTSSNIEPVARAIAGAICRRTNMAEANISAWVDRHWECAAAELEAGLIDERGDELPGYAENWERGLAAYRDTLLDHEHALQRLMPAAEAKGIQIVIGGPYSSGILAGGSHFEYADASPEILAKVAKVKALAQRHGVPIKAAALQFSLAHPAAVSVIPGASKPDRIKEDHDALKAKIPDDFWHEPRKEGPVAPNAPLPIDR